MSDLIETGRLIDWILWLMAIEGAAWLVLSRRSSRALHPASMLFNLLAGAALLLALREALVRAAWPAVAGWLAAAFCAHMGEMASRWLGAGPRSATRII